MVAANSLDLSGPVFALTADVDWASEFAIADFLESVAAFGIKPTIFVTHPSAVIDAAKAEGRIDVGWHPNFLPGSSHGSDVKSVIDYVSALAPDARCYRSHWFFDHTGISREMWERGIRFDSNLCLYLQKDLVPLQHGLGLVRLPVFWEDDVHFDQGTSWKFEDNSDHFFTPGIKILNVHPFIFSVNAPSTEFYLSVKDRIRNLNRSDRDACAWAAEGSRTFLIDCLKAITERGHRFRTLADIFDGLS